MDINVLVNTMLQLFIILLLGYGLNKTGIFNNAVNKGISSFIANVTAPLLVIYSVTTVDHSNKLYVFELIGAGILMYLVFILFGKMISKLLPVSKEDQPIYEIMCVFANTGFMGYPILLSLFDYKAVFIASMIHLPFNLFVFTYGVYKLNVSKNDQFKIDYKMMLTPGLLLTLLAVVLFMVDLQLPSVVLNTTSTIGNMTSPLSMLMIGSSLANYPLLESLTDYRAYLFSIIRLFVIGLLTCGVCNIMHVDTLVKSVLVITNSMPVASMVLILATEYNANVKVVTKNIFVTTVLCMITIPLMVSLLIL